MNDDCGSGAGCLYKEARIDTLADRVRVLREALEAIGRQCNGGLVDHLRLSRIESIAAEAMERVK